MLFLGQKRKLIKIKNNYVLLRFDSLGVCKWHYGLLRFERLGVNTDYYKMVTVELIDLSSTVLVILANDLK